MEGDNRIICDLPGRSGGKSQWFRTSLEYETGSIKEISTPRCLLPTSKIFPIEITTMTSYPFCFILISSAVDDNLRGRELPAGLPRSVEHDSMERQDFAIAIDSAADFQLRTSCGSREDALVADLCAYEAGGASRACRCLAGRF